MTSTFATFATSNFLASAKQLCASAEKVGFDRTKIFSPADIEGTEFYRKNAETLRQARGAGYWLWKPFLIRELVVTAGLSDVIVYSDAGRVPYYDLRLFPNKLIQIATANPGSFLLGPTIGQHGPLRKWTKRDCLQILQMDKPEILNRPIIQATWSIWKNTPQSRAFLNQWVEACEDPRCLTDNPNVLGERNYPDFVDHRHDQAIMTLLAYKLPAPYMDIEASWIARLLKMRPQSSMANYFLKRIDDCERIARAESFAALLVAFRDIRRIQIQIKQQKNI